MKRVGLTPRPSQPDRDLYGDITPATHQAQSLTIFEGVAGVLYVAVLIARIVNAYRGDQIDGES